MKEISRKQIEKGIHERFKFAYFWIIISVLPFLFLGMIGFHIWGFYNGFTGRFFEKIFSSSAFIWISLSTIFNAFLFFLFGMLLVILVEKIKYKMKKGN